jgi:hypothetical protein
MELELLDRHEYGKGPDYQGKHPHHIRFRGRGEQEYDGQGIYGARTNVTNDKTEGLKEAADPGRRLIRSNSS